MSKMKKKEMARRDQTYNAPPWYLPKDYIIFTGTKVTEGVWWVENRVWSSFWVQHIGNFLQPHMDETKTTMIQKLYITWSKFNYINCIKQINYIRLEVGGSKQISNHVMA